MQSQLIGLAAEAGADVKRGEAVTGVTRGNDLSVTLQGGTVFRARLVVGADGRQSQVRKWAGFNVSRDPSRLLITGALLTNMPIEDDTIHTFSPSSFGQSVLLFPLGSERVRGYFITARRDEHLRPSGAGHLPAFVRYCVETGVPHDWFHGIGLGGPLATFEGADAWVDHPYHEGIVLVGDAAAASDPSFGCGLSLSLRDVRTLRDLLLGTDDWDSAGLQYAAAHDRYYGSLHTIESWMTQIQYGLGPEADRMREHALPQLAKWGGPSFAADGPDFPTDEGTRRQLLGE